MAKTALQNADNQIPNNAARTNALLELISDQLMYAALCEPSLGSELQSKLGPAGGSAFIVLAERITQSRKNLGLEP
jgi:hypothetical protein